MSDTEEITGVDQASEPPATLPKAPPIESRFLFVDVAAMRAKQLRRGALVRLSDSDELADSHRAVPHKAERVAMEEVRRGLVLYEVPESDKPAQGESMAE